MAHALPAVFLLLAVGAVVAYDRLVPMLVRSDLPSIIGPRYNPDLLADRRPRVGIRYARDQRFGVVRLDMAAPDNPSGWKKLTARDTGETNNTRVKVAGHEYLFGELAAGRRWAPGGEGKALPGPYHGRQSTFRFANEEVDVTQYTQVVPGQNGLLDTVLIYYRVTNYGTVPQKVALRIMLDTFIGDNDGVPFLVPGQSKLVQGQADLQGRDVPPYLEVIENPNDAKDPGTVARLGLRGIQWSDDLKMTEPSRVVVSKFPGERAGWDWPLEDMRGDSCVAIYWPEVLVEANRGTAHFAFTYGLGTLEVNDDLALTGPAAVLPGGEFVVTGYVYRAKKGQKVTLDLPAGLEAAEGLERVVEEDADRAQVFWKVKAVKEGRQDIHADSNKSRSRTLRVVVKAGSIFG